MQMNRGKVVQQLETDVGSELSLTLFDVTHPGLAALTIDMFWQATSYPGVRDTETEWERDCLKPFIKMHSVTVISEIFCIY